MEGLWAALSSPMRAKATEAMLRDPSSPIAVRALAKEIGASPALVSIVAASLGREGILRRRRADLANPLTRALKKMFNIRELQKKGVVRIIRKSFRHARGVGVYGSYAAGTNDEKSDLDLWVKASKWSGGELSRAKIELSKKMGVDVQIIVVGDGTLEKSESPFYHSLYFASELLWGEGID